MQVPYTGNSAYCYANSLHMCLASVDVDGLPDPGFLECTTIMPFGAGYVHDGPAHIWFPSPIGIDPDEGLGVALENLGWSSESWHGEASDEEAAFEQLGGRLQEGPVLIGPIDMGYLTYDPHCAGKAGADHFVAALTLESDHVLVNDPQGFPLATLSKEDLIHSWRADRIGYTDKAFKCASDSVRRRQSVGRKPSAAPSP